jgi:EAL domain-containing protein (putative c-di-GMP-specific phosphodiesterase class I)
VLDASCVEALDASLAKHGVPPREVEFELTESSIMHDPERAVNILNIFRDRGVNFAIDDFGTGYSSLSYLRQLPVNALKIDRSFVSNMVLDSQDAAIVRSTIALAHSLDLKVIAEGVENDQILAALSAMNCDQGQGFGICQPQPLDRLVEWLAAIWPRPQQQTQR